MGGFQRRTIARLQNFYGKHGRHGPTILIY
jgi:hypothetical protein